MTEKKKNKEISIDNRASRKHSNRTEASRADETILSPGDYDDDENGRVSPVVLLLEIEIARVLYPIRPKRRSLAGQCHDNYYCARVCRR